MCADEGAHIRRSARRNPLSIGYPPEGGPTVSQLSDQRGRVIFPAQRAEVVGVATGAGAAVVARVAVRAGVLGWLR